MCHVKASKENTHIHTYTNRKRKNEEKEKIKIKTKTETEKAENGSINLKMTTQAHLWALYEFYEYSVELCPRVCVGICATATRTVDGGPWTVDPGP